MLRASLLATAGSVIEKVLRMSVAEQRPQPYCACVAARCRTCGGSPCCRCPAAQLSASGAISMPIRLFRPAALPRLVNPTPADRNRSPQAAVFGLGFQFSMIGGGCGHGPAGDSRRIGLSAEDARSCRTTACTMHLADTRTIRHDIHRR